MTTLLLRSLLLLLVGVASANPSANLSSNLLRGRNNGRSLSNDDWVAHPTDRNRRRRRLRPLAAEKEEDDCLMVLKLIDYEDDTLDEEVWACEFPHQLAVEVLNGNEFMDISGISKDVIDAFHPISGASILNTRDVFVEQALDTKVMTLMIPEDAQVDINVIEETHPRHHKQRRNRNRNLQGDPNNRALGEIK